MSLSVPNTGATAVAAKRYAVITQDRLVTSWNWRPMVGKAVATMVWSSAAKNIVSIRLMTMVRTSSLFSGAGGASGGASPMSMTSVGRCEISSAIVSDKSSWSADRRLCRSKSVIGIILVSAQLEPAVNRYLENTFRGKIYLEAAL